MTPLRITMADVAAAGFCARGARRWFENHNSDFRSFLKNGIALDEMSEAMRTDAFTVKASDAAKKREAENG